MFPHWLHAWHMRYWSRLTCFTAKLQLCTAHNFTSIDVTSVTVLWIAEFVLQRQQQILDDYHNQFLVYIKAFCLYKTSLLYCLHAAA